MLDDGRRRGTFSGKSRGLERRSAPMALGALRGAGRAHRAGARCTHHMRIAVVADPYIPIPPTLYGGIERIIAFLVAGLHARGHEVMLVAHPDSTIPCTQLVAYGCPPHSGLVPRATELAQVQRALCVRSR